jgi:RecB family exonuclease
MKAFYESLGSGKKPTMKLLNRLLEENWISDGYLSKSHEKGSFDKAKKFLKHYLNTTFNPETIPVVMEQPFIIRLDGLRVGGKIDRVDASGDAVHIVDYKTGATALTQKQADSDLQLSIYGLAATSIPEPPFNRNPSKVKLSLMYFDTPQTVTTTRTMDQLNEARKEIVDYKKQIEESDFECSKGYLCRSCEYKLFCRVDE